MQNSESAQPLPNIFIGQEIVNSRIESYLLDKYPLLREAQKAIGSEREETKSIWYSKEHIEMWLNEINLLNADGMRIYFGAYGDEENIAPGQLCLLMVLTRTAENGITENDIIYENEPDFTDRQNAGANARSIGEEESITGGIPKEFNYGSPCPPICK